MFKTEKLKALVNERLKAAAEEIFSIFETTIKDYEEIVFRSKQEVDQQQQEARRPEQELGVLTRKLPDHQTGFSSRFAPRLQG